MESGGILAWDSAIESSVGFCNEILRDSAIESGEILQKAWDSAIKRGILQNRFFCDIFFTFHA